MIVEVLFSRSDGVSVEFIAHAQLVGLKVGLLRLTEKLFSGYEITLRRRQYNDEWKSTNVRVGHEIDCDSAGYLYSFHLLVTGSDFWIVEFPPPETEDALGRLLMECSVCRHREVVPLKPVEVRAFEVYRCVARACIQCSAPSIWVEAPSENQLMPMSELEPAPKTEFLPARASPRMKSRLLACVRQRGYDEEAVCEDLSGGGVSFRSRTQYAEGSRIEIAVPFRPGTKAIFVPGRIVCSVPVRGVGLFRHGVSYLRVPPESKSDPEP
jgi:PilZ domain